MRNPSLVIGKAFKKYGIENFSFYIIEECENDKMSEREIYWIKELNTCIQDDGSWGYNMTHGGERLYGEDNPFYGKHHTTETKKILSDYSKQRTGEKNPFYNKHHSEETKQKISTANSGSKRSDELKQYMSIRNSGENNPFYGKKHSEETKKILSEKFKGRKAYNAIPWVAENDDGETIKFQSNGKIMQWLYDNDYINPDEHFTLSMLKNRLKKSETKNIKFMGYYWKKSVETIESIEYYFQEASRVDSEIDTESKCEDTINIV